MIQKIKKWFNKPKTELSLEEKTTECILTLIKLMGLHMDDDSQNDLYIIPIPDSMYHSFIEGMINADMFPRKCGATLDESIKEFRDALTVKFDANFIIVSKSNLISLQRDLKLNNLLK